MAMSLLGRVRRVAWFTPFLAAALALPPAGCSSGGKDAEPQQGAAVLGEVTSSRGPPLSGVRVARVGGAESGDTDGSGRVALTLPAGTDLVLRLTRSGFVDRLEPLSLPAGATSGAFGAVLLPREPPIAIAAIEGGGSATGKHGARVTFPPGALLGAGGQPAAGTVEVTLTPIDVSSGEALAFPGAYQGLPTGGSRAPIVSFGAADFEVSQGGSRLAFASGATAAVEIPLYATLDQDGTPVAAGQRIPLWSLDPGTGVWTQEGEAEVVASAASPTGLAGRATVSHFTPWNLDALADDPGPFQATLVKCVIGAGGDLPQRDLPAGTTCTVRYWVGGGAEPTEVRTEVIPAQGDSGPLPSGLVRLDGRARVSGAVLRGALDVDLPVGGSGPLVIVLDPLNAPPTANAGPDQTVPAGATVQLDGTGSRDPDGDPLTFAWSFSSRPAGSAAVPSDPAAAGPTFAADVPGSWVLRLVVSDGKAQSAPDTVRILVEPAAAVRVTIEATRPQTDETSELLGVFTVARTGPTDAALAVGFGVGGTATGGLDYADLGSGVTIPAGEPSATLVVLPWGDGLVEGPETVVVTLVDGAAYDLGNPSSATVTIADGVVRVNEVEVVASDALAAEAGPDAGAFTISRSGTVALPLEVAFTVGGTATGGADYAALPAIAAFLAGQSSVTVTVAPIPDQLVEGPETVILTLAAGTGYLLGASSSATVTIGDTALPAVTVAASDAQAAEPASPGAFTVSRSGPTAGALVVNLAAGGTASPGADYQALPATVTIPDGQAAALVPVAPADDAAAEGAETVTLTVAAGAGYAVGLPATATVTIADDDAPVVTIQATDPGASEAGDPGVFTITRTGPTISFLRIPFSVGGTAWNGTDYQAIGSEVVILSGQSSATVTIAPLADQAVEGSETVLLILALDLTGGYQLGSPSRATVTIAE